MEKTALITGASSGIGLELAICLAQKGYHLILVARRQFELNSLAETLKKKYAVRVLTLAQDLTQVGAIETITKALQGQPIQVLINNAGFGLFGPFSTSDIHSQLNMVALNIGAVTALTRVILPGLLLQKEGYILNVSSLSAYQPLPNMAVYAATKAYILSFSRSLSEELRGTGVHVLAASPGIIRTPFFNRAHLNEENVRLNLLPAMTASMAAKLMIRYLFAKKQVKIIGVRYQIIVMLMQVTTKLFGLRFLRMLLIK